MCFRHEADLVRSAMAPADARTIVRRMCNELHVEDLTDTAALLTSELVTNAIRHAAGPLHLDVACQHGQLFVSVQDGDPEPPRPRQAHVHERGGRGLTLVDELSEHWGFRQVPGDGKAVWFSLRPDHPPMPHDGCGCPDDVEATDGAGWPTSIPISRRGC